MARHLIFAYGSLLLQKEAENTAPGIKFKSRAVLRGYRLFFSHCSKGRKSGVADVIESPGDLVWGVIYELDEAGRFELDRREGHKDTKQRSTYWRTKVTVFTDESADSEALEVETYMVVNKSSTPHPASEYYKDIILRGAKERGLPDAYIHDTLESIIVQSE